MITSFHTSRKVESSCLVGWCSVQSTACIPRMFIQWPNCWFTLSHQHSHLGSHARYWVFSYRWEICAHESRWDSITCLWHKQLISMTTYKNPLVLLVNLTACGIKEKPSNWVHIQGIFLDWFIRSGIPSLNSDLLRLEDPPSPWATLGDSPCEEQGRRRHLLCLWSLLLLHWH